MSWVAIDFETANENRASVCAVGLAIVNDGQVIRTQSQLIRPHDLYFNPQNVAIHGITEADVRDKPRFYEVWKDLRSILEGSMVVAHNARFDISVLRHVLDQYEITYPTCDYLCTCTLARKAWPHLPNHRLDTIASHLKITFKHHDARDDALACAKIAMRCLDEAGAGNLNELATIYGVTTGKLHPGGCTPCSRHSDRAISRNRRIYQKPASTSKCFVPQDSHFGVIQMSGLQYRIEVRHDGLNKYRIIKGSESYVVEQKARTQLAQWDEMWQRRCAIAQKTQERQANKSRAIAQTQDAEQAIENIRNTLKHTLPVNDAITWDSLKNKLPYSASKPQLPAEVPVPREPKSTDDRYQPKIGFWDKIFLWWAERKSAEAVQLFAREYAQWQKSKEKTIELNRMRQEEYRAAVRQWNAGLEAHRKKQERQHEKIEKKKQQYLGKEPNAILDYCDMVLSNSQYPDSFPQDWELDYNVETCILVVDYALPHVDHLPKIKEVKYIQARDELKESLLTEKELNELYDGLLYQIALRTVHELFEADVVEAIHTIVFNGWVRSVDKSTGNEVNPCIMSMQAERNEFLALNLADIDAKACFKKLKGVGSSQLYGLAPIAPILEINREDKRFIQAYDVANTLDESSNLATMDWADFEHLIRELFEKEFSQSGGEVKITQASRDGGVDAVAFDPDPIRGGKIVIQAKRYTNTVGVAAVRDLYGTVINEGATKGILVTTSDYGPDAHKFALDKPITLLNGSNLLHLLAKHGHKARIDLKEAKQQMAG